MGKRKNSLAKKGTIRIIDGKKTLILPQGVSGLKDHDSEIESYLDSLYPEFGDPILDFYADMDQFPNKDE